MEGCDSKNNIWVLRSVFQTTPESGDVELWLFLISSKTPSCDRSQERRGSSSAGKY